ncbi:FAD:protein FMN transferase [Christiangramia aquimixticola]|uniref:FAD:protein FMN transferase n=1 Tax=Christiangramia aquimixticola TaxID=1697558 RepID=UPI003AA8565F
MLKKLILLVVLISLSACGEQDVESQKYQGEALGTTYAIQFYSEEEIAFEKGMDSIINQINKSMSTYSTNSDISKVNRGDTTVKVDAHFLKVLEASRKIYEESNGFFDPTVGVLVNAYGFGPEKQINELYTETLDSLNNLVGLNKISIKKNGAVSKSTPGVYLDFNAIAKGYAIDVIADYLESKAVENYLIELGGELRAKGKNLKSGNSWLVGIDDPFQKQERNLKAKLKLDNASMATSGNYRKYRVDSVSGRQFVHTVNPITGFAEKSNLLSATVIAENCMLADGYATAMMAMGLDRTKEMLNRVDGIEVYLMYSNANGDLQTYISPSLKEKLVK